MHHATLREQITLIEIYEGSSANFTRCCLVAGAVHMSAGLCSLEQGHVDTHLHSFEESFYVLEGRPVLYLGDDGARLEPGSCGVIPVGVAHSWVSDSEEPARWIDMVAPRARGIDGPADTFFLGPPPSAPVTRLDVRDPRVKHLFHLGETEMSVGSGAGAHSEPLNVSPSMENALLVYSGITVKMLVDQRLGADLQTMFMVEYQPGGVAHPHDHPFEEFYYLLEGEVHAIADGEEYTLRPGDAFWTGVGCVHAFYNTSGKRIRWLETQAPQPPAKHSYRFSRDWDYLADRVADVGATITVADEEPTG